jgi:GntR family histidine utilization transcriptional repressor
VVFDERVVAMAIAEVDAELAVLFNEAGGESAPAYERVKNLVVSQINSGRWTEGDQLPSENQLVSALGLSRMTINRALRELTSDGLIVRMMGVGTFVAATKTASPLFEVKNIADEIQRRGHRHRTEVVFVREEETDHGQTFLRESVGKRVPFADGALRGRNSDSGGRPIRESERGARLSAPGLHRDHPQQLLE